MHVREEKAMNYLLVIKRKTSVQTSYIIEKFLFVNQSKEKSCIGQAFMYQLNKITPWDISIPAQTVFTRWQPNSWNWNFANQSCKLKVHWSNYSKWANGFQR